MTTPSNTIEELVGRVEAATGPEREIDGLLHAQLVMGWDYAHFVASEGYWFRQNEISRSPNHVSYAFGGDRVADDEVPRYTASVDAALALAERLHGVHWYSILLDAVREFGVSGVKPPADLPRYICLATLSRIKGDHNDEA